MGRDGGCIVPIDREAVKDEYRSILEMKRAASPGVPESQLVAEIGRSLPGVRRAYLEARIFDVNAAIAEHPGVSRCVAIHRVGLKDPQLVADYNAAKRLGIVQ